MVDDLFPRETRRSLPIALLRAREAMMQHFRPMLAVHDLTEQQWRVLRVLAESGAKDATQLAELAQILGPSLSRYPAAADRAWSDRTQNQLGPTQGGSGIDP